MTATEKIIKYMELKRKLTLPIYFFPEDEQDIRDNEDRNDTCWEHIKETPEDDRFTSEDCPFCFYYDCDSCSYGERHGKCGNPGSTWDAVTDLNTTIEQDQLMQKKLQELVDKLEAR